MRLYDTFLFAGELDMLECRLTELSPVVDAHVLVEAPVDFRGVPKPLHYAENRERFARWNDKIIYRVAQLPDTPDPWQREFASREHILGALSGVAEPDDLMLLSDVDEIPKLSAIETAAGIRSPMVFEQRMSVYALEWVYPHPWCGTISCPFGLVSGVEALRHLRNELPRIPDGGWHLSWMGTLEQQSRKISTTAHTEMTEETKQAIRTGRFVREGVHSDGVQLVRVDFDAEEWPAWVQASRPESWLKPW